MSGFGDLPPLPIPSEEDDAIVIGGDGKLNDRDSNQIKARLSRDEVAKLDAYCKINGITRSAAIRMSVMMLIRSPLNSDGDAWQAASMREGIIKGQAEFKRILESSVSEFVKGK